MTENWKQSLDQGGHYGAPLADLSKAIDCIMHDLLTAKLQEYDFDNNSLNFIFNICQTINRESNNRLGYGQK